MPRLRQIYATDLLYVGPTGANPASGQLNSTGIYGNYTSATSGNNYIAELFRIQKTDYDWNKKLRDVNQFGQLGQVDRVLIDPPSVTLSYSYLLANLVNESLIGLTVNKAGDTVAVSCLSGILSTQTDDKNYFIKTVSEGSDAISTNPNSYTVVSFGNCFLSSYTSQGSIGNFPTVDIALTSLNAQAQIVTQTVGAMTPAVYPSNGTNVTGWGYVLPTGVTSFNNVGLSNLTGISVLRPGDISLNLGIGAGDGFADFNDIKPQSYNISVNLNLEDLQQLGSKFAYAKVPKFPVEASLTVNCLIGDFQTGSLVEIVNNNLSFNPSITLTAPGTTTPVVYYQLRNAKLDSQSFSESIGSNKTVNFTFMTTIGGPSDVINGFYMSGISANI